MPVAIGLRARNGIECTRRDEMNKVILLGRLVRDPEIKYTTANEPLAVARYTLAVDRKFKRQGEPEADFINCVAFGKSAVFIEKYVKKGQRIAVAGVNNLPLRKCFFHLCRNPQIGWVVQIKQAVEHVSLKTCI